MKKTLLLLLCGVMALSVTACGADTAASDESILTMAVSSEPDSLDPMLSSASDTESTIMFNVYEGLLSFNPAGEFLPALSESYEVSADGLSYTFKLKEGVVFHNGAPFTSADVKYTYDTLAGLGGNPPLEDTLNRLIESVSTDGDYSVTINLKERNAGFLTQCIIPICPKGYENAAQTPIGTGPYKFKEYIPGQKVTLVINEDYNTDANKTPSIQTVEIRIMTDENARLMALKSGSIDLSLISSKDVETLSEGFNIVEAPSNSVQLMGLNNAVEPFNDIRIRQAVNYAINKDEIIDGAFAGGGTKVNAFLSPVMEFYYNGNITPYETDVEKAKALLKEAGYENGFTFTFTVPNNYREHIDSAQIIKDQLSKVGITAEIELVEWAAWLEDVYNNAEYEATIIVHTGKLDPNDFLNRFDSSYANNYFKYSNEEYDALIAQGAVNTDETKRAEIYKKCQQILSDEAAAVFIHDMSSVYAVAKNLNGFETYPVLYYNFAAMEIVN